MATGIMMGTPREFLWNIEAHVGPYCPNKPGDVQLVQLGYICAKPKAIQVPALKAAIDKIVWGAPYNGGANDPLTLAIKAHQKHMGGVQDGKVSPIQVVPSIPQALATWMLTALMLHTRNDPASHWPLLSKRSGCPAALAAAVATVFGAKEY